MPACTNVKVVNCAVYVNRDCSPEDLDTLVSLTVEHSFLHVPPDMQTLVFSNDPLLVTYLLLPRVKSFFVWEFSETVVAF